MGTQLNPEPVSQLQPGQYTLPLYTSQALQGYHLKVIMGHKQEIRQPFALNSFFNSFAEFSDSGVLPHLIQLLWSIYGVEPQNGDDSVWRQLEIDPDAEFGDLHPTFGLMLNNEAKDLPEPWFIALVYETATVARSVR